MASIEMIDCFPTVARPHAHREAGMGTALFVVVDFGLRHNLHAAIETIGRNTVPQVRLSGRRVYRQCRVLQLVMRTPHATTRRCLTTLLNSHCNLLCTAALLRRHCILFTRAGLMAGSSLVLVQLRLQCRKRSCRLLRLFISRFVTLARRRILVHRRQRHCHDQHLFDDLRRADPFALQLPRL